MAQKVTPAVRVGIIMSVKVYQLAKKRIDGPVLDVQRLSHNETASNASQTSQVKKERERQGKSSAIFRNSVTVYFQLPDLFRIPLLLHVGRFIYLLPPPAVGFDIVLYRYRSPFGHSTSGILSLDNWSARPCVGRWVKERILICRLITFLFEFFATRASERESRGHTDRTNDSHPTQKCLSSQSEQENNISRQSDLSKWVKRIRKESNHYQQNPLCMCVCVCNLCTSCRVQYKVRGSVAEEAIEKQGNTLIGSLDVAEKLDDFCGTQTTLRCATDRSGYRHAHTLSCPSPTDPCVSLYGRKTILVIIYYDGQLLL